MQRKRFFSFLIIFTFFLMALNGCSSATQPTENQDLEISQVKTEEKTNVNLTSTSVSSNNPFSSQPISSTAQTLETTDGRQIVVSKMANNGCKWELFDASIIHLQFPVQNCKDDGIHAVFNFKVEGNSIVQYMDGKKDLFNPKLEQNFIEVFPKEFSQKPENILHAQFIKNLSAKEQKECVVKKLIMSPITGTLVHSGEKLYMIVPTDSYLEELHQATMKGEGPVDAACGERYTENGIHYFLFKDNQPHIFAFVGIATATPLFDEQNIIFLGH